MAAIYGYDKIMCVSWEYHVNHVNKGYMDSLS